MNLINGLKTLADCKQALREIEEKWEEQDQEGYMRDSYDARYYCAILNRIKRFEWAKDKENLPDLNTLLNWGNNCRNYTLPQLPTRGYLKIGQVDEQQLRRDYWEFFGDN